MNWIRDIGHGNQNNPKYHLLQNSHQHRGVSINANKKELGKKLKPDKIYGLRATNNFQEAMYAHAHHDPSQEGKLVRDLLTLSPVSSDGDPLLFPFLILEAKSGKSAAKPTRTCHENGLGMATWEHRDPNLYHATHVIIYHGPTIVYHSPADIWAAVNVDGEERKALT